jgi:hypothetical protein
MYALRQIRVPVGVDIHRVTLDCTPEYEGTVQLNRPAIEVGIPSNRWSRLVFVFDRFSFFSIGAARSRMKPCSNPDRDITMKRA